MTTEKTGYKVLIVEDHPMFRDHLSELIDRELGMFVCGEADNIQDAMEIIDETKPDIAIVDITLKGSSGLELIKDIKSRGVTLTFLCSPCTTRSSTPNERCGPGRRDT